MYMSIFHYFNYYLLDFVTAICLGFIFGFLFLDICFSLTQCNNKPLVESLFLIRDQSLSLWRRSTNSKTLDYQKTKPQFSSVQLLSRIQFFATPWIAAHQASLSITNSRSSLRLMSIESVMPSSHLILGRPLLLLPPIPPSITVFSNESTLHIRWPKYWSQL